MFKNLKVQNIKGLRECKLFGLGKINVICGKNNSGKSTLLEGIASKDKRSIGKQLSESDIEKIYTDSVIHTGWNGHESRETENRLYREIVETVSQSRTWWFGDDREEFTTEVRKAFGNNVIIAKWAFPGSISRILEGKFAENFPTVLLPPKRHLELKTNINTNHKPSPSGEGILNYLFYAKNQYTGAEERQIYDAISNAFIQISSGYSFDVFAESENLIKLSFTNKTQTWIDAASCGLGLQDLLVILVFAIIPDNRIILIEEPESHLHPDMQRRLLSYIGKETDKQFFLTTHSNVFLDNALVNKVLFTKYEGHVLVDDVTSRASILGDLGYSVTDNLVSDLIILVEGPSDVPVIEEFLVKMGLYSSYDIKMWPLGGDIMDQLDLSVFSQNYSIVAIVDSDPKSERIRKRFERKCGEASITFYRLKRYSIENYFTVRALRAVFASQISDTITEIDPNKKLEEQISINVKNNNRRLAQEMSIEEIEDTDLKRFLDDVAAICSSGKLKPLTPSSS